ncbi:MAG: response regulator [Sphingobacteriia bacterium]|nr:MAG: response regulator [Sphingobacteriia bacterium]
MNKVLIVEQEPILMAIVEKRLLAEGWETAACGDGKTARELIDSFQPDMLITNLLIPFYSGKEVIAYALEKLPKLFIIIVALFQQEDAKEEHLEMGVHTYYSKPFDLEELVAFIQVQKTSSSIH